MKDFWGILLFVVLSISAIIIFAVNLTVEARGMKECVRQGHRAEDCEWIYKDFVK